MPATRQVMIQGWTSGAVVSFAGSIFDGTAACPRPVAGYPTWRLVSRDEANTLWIHISAPATAVACAFVAAGDPYRHQHANTARS